MPTYEYVCAACEHEFEEFQQMSAKTLRKCPECGKLKLERKIGIGAGIIFKGGGFYETDYRSDGYKKAAEADKKAKENGKTDAKKKKDGNGSGGSGSCACGKKPTDQCKGSTSAKKDD